MPTTILDGDVISCKVACMAADQLGLNDFAFGITNPTGTPTYEDFVTYLNGVLIPIYEAILPATAMYYGFSAQRIQPTFSQPFTLADPGPGTAMGNLSPRQACGVISKKGILPGRPGRGRIYIPFLATSNTSDAGHLSPAGKLALDALGNLIFVGSTITVSVGSNVQLAPLILNRLAPGYNLITTFQTRLKLATQKRRGDYGKPNSAPW